MREAGKNDFIVLGLGSHVFQLVEWALVVGAVGFAAERMQSDGMEIFTYVLRFFVFIKLVEIVWLIGGHYTGIYYAHEFEEKYKKRMPPYLVVLIFFSYIAALSILGLPAFFMTEQLLEVARELARENWSC